MQHLRDKLGRDFAASQTGNPVVELMVACPPLALDELLHDPKVRERVGDIISLAMTRPPERQGRRSVLRLSAR
jgi:hypothetical protein